MLSLDTVKLQMITFCFYLRFTQRSNLNLTLLE